MDTSVAFFMVAFGIVLLALAFGAAISDWILDILLGGGSND